MPQSTISEATSRCMGLVASQTSNVETRNPPRAMARTTLMLMQL